MAQSPRIDVPVTPDLRPVLRIFNMISLAFKIANEAGAIKWEKEDLLPEEMFKEYWHVIFGAEPSADSRRRALMSLAAVALRLVSDMDSGEE